MHRRRMQDFLSLEYISQGRLFIRSGSTGYIAERGELCVLMPFQDHEIYHHDETESCTYGFVFRGSRLLDMIRFFRLDQVDAVRVKDESSLLELHARLYKYLKEEPSDPVSLRKSAGMAFELLTLISGNCLEANCSPMTAEALRLMEEGLASRLEMGSFAERFHCSLPTFNKRFEADIGETPYQHLKRMRLSRAAELLRSGTEPIKEVAISIGYASPIHFWNDFRRLYGVSPRDYRSNSFDDSEEKAKPTKTASKTRQSKN